MDAQSVAQALGRAHRNGAGWKCSCPLAEEHNHGDRNPSFEVKDAGGKLLVACHGAHSGQQDRVIEALKKRGFWLNGNGNGHNGSAVRSKNSEWVALAGAPGDLPDPLPKLARHNDKFGPLTDAWSYLNLDGTINHYRLRYEKIAQPDGERLKSIIPYSYSRNTITGAHDWRFLDPPKPRILYNLPALIARPEAPVLVVEGEKTAEAAQELLPGYVVTTWSGGAKRYKETDFSPLRGRRVSGFPDQDPDGYSAMSGIAGEVPRMLLIDPDRSWPLGWDLADAKAEGWTTEQALTYIRDHEITPTIAVERWNEAGQLTKAGTKKTEAEMEDPVTHARLFVERDFTYDGSPTLNHWNGSFWGWDRAAHRPLPEDEIGVRLHVFLRDNVRLMVGSGEKRRSVVVQRKQVAEATAALRSLVHSSDPSARWLRPRATDPTDRENLIALKNGIIDLSTRTLFPPNPRFLNLTALAVEYCESATCPNWLEYLDQIFVGDRATIGLLQESFGYLVSGDRSLQKILNFIGPRRAGKGTVRNVLKRLQPDSCVELSMADLATPFGLERTVGRSVGIIGDARVGARDRSTVLEKLLTISGGDNPPIARKFLPAYTGDCLLRFLILTNDLIYAGTDASGALAHRLVPIEFPESFEGREDPTILERLLVPELSGILLWALDGWERLQERGRFALPESSEDLIEQIADLHHPLAAFVHDECRPANIDDEIPHGDKENFFLRYVVWCARRTPQVSPRSRDWFFRDIQSAGLNCNFRWDAITKTSRTIDGKSAARWIKGWKLKNE